MRSPLLPIFAGCLTIAVAAGAALGLMPRAVAADGTLAAAQRELPEEMQKRETWRKSLLLTPLPAKGCFTAAYPDKGWRKVPCKPSTPHKLFLPHAGGITQLEQIGGNGGTDFSATVTGHISTAEGSFDSATGITSNNAYSLQLNTQHFTTSACSGSPNNTGSPTTGCRGWEQFVYESGGSAFTQYWLLDYGPWGPTQCPVPRHVGCAVGASYSDGWCPVQISLEMGDTNQTQCVINAVNEPSVPSESMASMSQVKVAGSAASTGDTFTVTIGGTPNPVSGDNRLPGLDTHWTEAEFNAFGGGNSAATSFNSGTNVVVRTQVLSGTNAGPGCDMRSFTGESTNLTLGNTPPASPGPPGPALVFSQSYPAPAGPPSCAGAASIGDTHQTTFGGLLYDFQAAGDFLLADTGRDFIVETRQVSGAPTWPNADVNSAVAVRTGGHRVAICTPDRVIVDGKPVAFGDRNRIGFPGGGGIARKDNAYTVFSAVGDSVHAEMDGTYINVSVGLGKWPSKVRGLLSNANTVNQIASRDGQVFTANFGFDDLYHHYADSWRVPAKDDLLSDCGPAREIGIAKAPFYAKDLDPKLAERARAICTEAGVKNGPLLDACVLDVVVLKSPAAAKVYAHTRPPVAVGLIVQRGRTGGVKQ